MSEESRFSLPREHARVITTTHKTRPQMEAISSRNLIKVLPWVNVQGGTYRVNRRQMLEIKPGMVTIVDVDPDNPTILGESLAQMPSFRNIKETALLDDIAAAASQDTFTDGASILANSEDQEHIRIIASGSVRFYEPGSVEDDDLIGEMGAGNYFGEYGLFKDGDRLVPFDAIASSDTIILKITYVDIKSILDGSAEDTDHIADHLHLANELGRKVNRKGETAVDIYHGLHEDEPDLPSTWVAYDPKPREYELSTAQTILKIHSKIADLYNNPYNQTEEQVRLTIEELKEAQEFEMINNDKFGLLHNIAKSQRLQTETGPPTPYDLDCLLSKRRKTQYLLAHPRAIAAFTDECSKQGIYPATVEFNGKEVIAWRGVPMLTCNKLQVVNGKTNIIAMRVGEEEQGVVGLYQMGIPEEVEPSLSVRFMGIDEKAIISYLITNYFSVAILVSDACGVLESVEV